DPPSGFCAGRDDLPDLVEDRGVYDADDLSIVGVAITGDAAAIAAVEADTEGAKADVVFQSGELGAGATQPNASLKLRGHTSRRAKLKSYRIKMKKGQPHWRDQRIIHFSKHPYDLTRLRNKLAFDYFKSVP